MVVFSSQDGEVVMLNANELFLALVVLKKEEEQIHINYYFNNIRSQSYCFCRVCDIFGVICRGGSIR